ncbi:hypothetical protein D3C84_1016280 [compost metagenome]
MVDDVDVVARTAGHPVGTGASVEGVVATTTHQRVAPVTTEQEVGALATLQRVRQAVANPNEVPAAQVAQVIGGRAQGVDRQGRLHLIEPLPRQLIHHIRRVVDDVDVVAGAP